MSRVIRQRLTKLERISRPRSQRKVHVVCGMTKLEVERKVAELHASHAWTHGDGLLTLTGLSSVAPDHQV